MDVGELGGVGGVVKIIENPWNEKPIGIYMNSIMSTYFCGFNVIKQNTYECCMHSLYTTTI